MIPAEYYPQLYEELKVWRELNTQPESVEEKRTRLRAELEQAKRAMMHFHTTDFDQLFENDPNKEFIKKLRLQ